MGYTGKKPTNVVDVSETQSLTVDGDLTVDTNTLKVDSTNNRVGIGTTTTDDAALTITNSVTRVNNWDAKLALQSTGASDFPALLFSGAAATNRYGGIVSTADITGNTPANETAEINFQLATATAGTIVFRTNGDIGTSNTSERVRILSSGGLTFNGDTATANALDDYEEGTWTPTYIPGGGTLSITYDIQVGIYRKVGGLVHAAFVLRSDAASGGSGSLFISGLPFAGSTTTNAFYSGSIGYVANFSSVAPQAIHIGSNGTTIVLITHSSSDGRGSLSTQVSTSNLSNSTNSNFIVGQMTYPTDAQERKMALTKETEYDCEVRGIYKNVQVRVATVVKDDGVEISRNYHRHVLHCRTKSGDTWGDTDISSEDATVQAVCNAVWTDSVKSAYETFMDSQPELT